MTEPAFDVVVGGAGPAGTAAAIDLRRAGARVLLVDRPSQPGGKACAGALTTKAVRRLRFDLGPVARLEERTVEFRRAGRRVGRVSTAAPVATMTVRAEFDVLCLRQALAHGAERRSAAIDHLEEEPAGVFVRLSNGEEVRSRFVVGADGASSRIRRLVGGPRQRQALALEGTVPARLMPGLDGMLFDVAAIPGGYGWAFRKGDHVNVGLYACDRTVTVTKAGLADYARRAFGVDRVEGMIGHPLGIGDPRPWLGTARVLLAGDAAGAAERLLGEGIHNALASGQAAAAAILAALRDGGGAQVAYAGTVRAVADDVELCDRISRPFYRWPLAGCGLLGIPAVAGGLAGGFARGLPLRAIVDERSRRNLAGRVAVSLLGLAGSSASASPLGSA